MLPRSGITGGFYTTGVPAMIGAMLVVNGHGRSPASLTWEEFDPDPYMDALNRFGLHG